MKTVEARDVEVGDMIYNSHAQHPAFEWVRVMKVSDRRGMIEIKTNVWTTIKHKREAVAVQ